MPFSKSVPLTRLISLITSLSLILPILFPFMSPALKTSSQTSDNVKRTQGAPSRNLPNIDEARGIQPGLPKIMPPVPATKCRGRDEKCKKAREKISSNLHDSHDQPPAHAAQRSLRDYVADWLNTGIPALPMLVPLIWSACIISDFLATPYRDGRGALTESAAKGANPRGETYDNAPSANGVGGALPAEHPADTQPAAPRKEYGYRGGRSRSLVAAQSGNIVTVNPSAYETSGTPDLAQVPVESPSNTGHALTGVDAPISEITTSQSAFCRWFGFPAVAGNKLSVKLKIAYASSGSHSLLFSSNTFRLSYSLDGGNSWTDAVSRTKFKTSESGTFTLDLPISQDLTQVQVRDALSAGSTIETFASAAATISNIRIEVEVPDTTAPVISNVVAQGINLYSATITWNTNEGSDSQVEYGPTTAYGQSTALNTLSVTAHSQDLFGLKPGTEYHYRVKSKDASGNLAFSTDRTFTTDPLDITYVTASDINASCVTFTWNTNVPTDSQVEYGTTTAYGKFEPTGAPNPVHVTAHSIRLTGLAAGTVYHYRVRSRDQALNLVVSGDYTFTTGPLMVSNLKAVNITTTSATITWNTNDPTNSQVEYGITPAYGDYEPTTPPTTPLATEHSIVLTGLTPGTVYYYRTRSRDAAGNLAFCGGSTFTTASNLSMALIDPNNRIGLPREDLLSRNYNWTLPLLSLPGRAGLDLSLTLSLNSLVYTRADSVMHFDADQGDLGPGFRLGFAEIRSAFTNTDAGVQSYLLSLPSGRRVEFRQINTNVYEAVDSSYMLLTHDPVSSVFVLFTTDGAQCRFVDVTGLGDYKCVQVKDRYGNYITIDYGSLAEIRKVTDTLGREINFNYDGSNHLLSITQNRGGQTRIWATFAYGTQTVQTNFPGLTLNGTANGVQESVLLRVGLADGSIYSFDYNTYAQVKTIRRYAPNNSNPVNFPDDYLQLAYTTYGLPDSASDPQTDCPRITSRTDWAYNWNPGVTSYYEADPSHAWGQVTLPDLTVYKEFFATTGWQRGLLTRTENRASGVAGGVLKNWVTLQWTQDNTGVSYRLNPRLTETIVNDDAGNRRRTTTSYTTSFGLPSDVKEYAPDDTTELRHMHTDYNLSAAYTGRRIIGLPQLVYLYGPDNALESKTGYVYDDFSTYPLQSFSSTPIQYVSPGTTALGLATQVRSYDVNAPATDPEYLETMAGYYVTGQKARVVEPTVTENVGGAPQTRTSQVTIDYTDRFPTSGNGNITCQLSAGVYNCRTYAFPTVTTDAENYNSQTQYDYHTGLVVKTVDPKQASTTKVYDSNTDRLMSVTNNVTQSTITYGYAPDQTYVTTTTTLVDGAGATFSMTVFDGHGRIVGKMSDHPNKGSSRSSAYTFYDVMGRPLASSNLTETDSDWNPNGDDIEGWAWSGQKYDWKGRPEKTYRQGFIKDNTDAQNEPYKVREMIYNGDSSVGGSVTILEPGNDSQRRQSSIRYDELGREKQAEVLAWEGGDVYLTTTYTYNARDQVLNIAQTGGVSGQTQNTETTYDGYGRLKTRKRPEESGPTTYDYYDDGTLKSAIDARGAKGEYGYFPRKLMRISKYTATANACPADYSAGSDCVAPTPTVTFSYDEVGNRTLMDDGPGKVVYGYDMASRLIEEKRYFDVINNPNTSVPPDESGRRPFIIGYAYNNSGLLKKVTDPFGSEILYNRYKTGKLSSVTGTPYAGTSQYASNITYRAWGAPKQVNYGDGYAASMKYNAALQLTEFDIPGISNQNGYHAGIGGTYTYFPDGRVSTIKAQTTTNSQYYREQDRAFTYDHMGRVKTVRSAQNADLGATGPFQFKQDYDYDEFGNMTKRRGWFWEVGQYATTYGPDTQVTGEFNATYVNNRATQANDFEKFPGTPNTVAPKAQTWEYDPMGKLKKISTTNSQGQPIATAHNIFDVLGRSKPFPNSPNLDGEGRNVGAGIYSIGTIAMVRSTVLGGEVLTETDTNGNKLKTYVYAEGELLAEQGACCLFNPNPQPHYVLWHHRDPLNTMSLDIYRQIGQTSSQNSDNGVQYAVDPAGTMVRSAGVAVQDIHYNGSGQPWTSFYQPGVDATIPSSNPVPGKVGWDCSNRLVNGGVCGGQIRTSQEMREGMAIHDAYVRTKTSSSQGFNGSDGLLPANYSPGVGGSPLGTHIRREAWTGLKIFDEVEVGLDHYFWEFVPGGAPRGGTYVVFFTGALYLNPRLISPYLLLQEGGEMNERIGGLGGYFPQMIKNCHPSVNVILAGPSDSNVKTAFDALTDNGAEHVFIIGISAGVSKAILLSNLWTGNGGHVEQLITADAPKVWKSSDPPDPLQAKVLKEAVMIDIRQIGDLNVRRSDQIGLAINYVGSLGKRIDYMNNRGPMPGNHRDSIKNGLKEATPIILNRLTQIGGLR